MISHKHKCIFIHIPKTAGTSIERKLGHTGLQDHRSIRTIYAPSVPILAKLLLIRDFRNIYHIIGNTVRRRTTVNEDQLVDYYKFSVVRNPWSRLFSWYRNVLRDEKHRLAHGITQDCSFKDFIRHHSFSTYSRSVLKPQTSWLFDFNKKVGVDFVCKFENLDEDISAVFDRLDIVDKKLPRLIAGDGSDYRDAYTDDLIDWVSYRYADEIAIFGYEFAE